MTQKPLSEMADRGYENMSEESGYVLHELKAFAAQVSAKIDAKASQENLLEVITQLDTKTSREEILEIVQAAIANHHQELFDSLAVITSRVEMMSDIVFSITSLSNKIDSLKAAVLVGFAKVDAEDVTNLDTNYEAAVSALLV